jgi:hypothetical protein
MLFRLPDLIQGRLCTLLTSIHAYYVSRTRQKIIDLCIYFSFDRSSIDEELNFTDEYSFQRIFALLLVSLLLVFFSFYVYT